MRAVILYLCFGFWLIHLFDEGLPALLAALALLILFVFRFNSRFWQMAAILVFGLAAFQMAIPYGIDIPPSGLYQITELKKTYAIASLIEADAVKEDSEKRAAESKEESSKSKEQKPDGKEQEEENSFGLLDFLPFCPESGPQNWKIYLSSEQELYFDQVYELKSSDFEEVHSLNNFNLFSFQKWLNGKDVYYQAQVNEGMLASQPKTLQNSILKKLRSLSHSDGLLYLFYGWKPEWLAESISVLALPFLALLYTLDSIEKRFIHLELRQVIACLLMLFYSICFGWHPIIGRTFLFYWIRLTAKDYVLKPAYVLALTTLFFPDQAGGFALILQAFQAASRAFLTKPTKVFSMLFMALMQLCLFGQGDWLTIIGFSLFRKLTGWLILLLCLLDAAGLLEEITRTTGSFIPWLSFEQGLNFNLDHPFIWRHSVGFIGTLMVMVFVFYLFKKGKGDYWKGLLAILLCLRFSMIVTPFFHVYMLDIGQGDCTLIVEPFLKSAVLIDAAASTKTEHATEVIVPFLQSLDVQKLDLVIISHDDLDHAGSLEALQSQFPVARVITERDEKAEMAYYMESLLVEREAEDENEESIISYFAYDGISYLWMGDASAEIEEQLILQVSLQPDVLKLGHHGSKTSSGYEFLKEVRPRLALISAGFQNMYNHPSPEVIERLEQLDIPWINTAEQGAIHLFSIGGFLFVETADSFALLKTPWS